MSDTDRLADYFARLENDDYRRTLADGCSGCGHSTTSCQSTTWTTNQPCCQGCAHNQG